MWNYFKSIDCINLKSRKDRYENCLNNASKLNLPLNFHFVDKLEDGKQGCFESHQNIIRRNKHLDNCLIFEDDFECSDSFKIESLQEVYSFMNTNKDWDIIYLGCFPDAFGSKQINIKGNIYFVKSTCTHAYICSQRFMNDFVNEKYSGIPIDEVFQKYQTYAFLPSLFRQQIGKTDVSSISFISTLSFKHKIEQLNELYAINFGDLPLKTFICVCVVTFYILNIHNRIKWSLLSRMIFHLCSLHLVEQLTIAYKIKQCL